MQARSEAMARPPELACERLRLVPFAEQHLSERYVGWLNDAEVVRYSEQRHRRHSPESCRAYWRSFEDTPNLFWAIVARDPGLGHIGNLSVYVDEPNLVADVTILIGEKRAWNRGLGSEAWSAVCDYLLAAGGMRKVSAGTLAENAGMLGIMRRAGMVEDGRRIRHYLLEDREVDVVHLALFRSIQQGHRHAPDLEKVRT